MGLRMRSGGLRDEVGWHLGDDRWGVERLMVGS